MRQTTTTDDDRQALAVTLGLLLLIGGVLLLREVAGVWWAFTITAGAVVGAYYLPDITRRLITRRAVRRLRRALRTQ